MGHGTRCRRYWNQCRMQYEHLKLLKWFPLLQNKQYEQNLSHIFDIEENPVVNTKMAMSYSEERYSLDIEIMSTICYCIWCVSARNNLTPNIPEIITLINFNPIPLCMHVRSQLICVIKFDHHLPLLVQILASRLLDVKKPLNQWWVSYC